jgi:hypothetical protein
MNGAAVNGAAVNGAVVNQTNAGGADWPGGASGADSHLLWLFQCAGLTAFFLFSWVHTVSFVLRGGCTR